MDDAFWPARPGTALRRARVVRRGAAVLLATVPAMAAQSVLLRTPGRAKVQFARAYWAGVCRLLGLRVQVLGMQAAGSRPVVFASNHSSWLDIAVLGGVLEACFVAKAEVGRWPFVGTVARLGRTVFVTRRPRDTGRERDGMLARLQAGDNLLLFPEGTSNDGSRVLPFRSTFFAVCEEGVCEGAPPLVQPVSVVYDRLGGMPVGRSTRALFAWYGDMALGPHFWRLAQEQGMRATVLLHPPLDPADYPSRKALAAAAWDVVAAGAAQLRQGRPAP